MQGTIDSRRATKHYSTLGRWMSIFDIGKYGVPVRSAVVRWCSKAGDGVPIAPDICDHDVLYVKRRMSMAELVEGGRRTVRSSSFILWVM